MASAANRKYGSNNAGNRGDDSQEEQDNILKCICNICLDNARDAVISLCGHLFCWSCLHQWLETEPFQPLCPVCKSSICQDKIIPIYGPGTTKQEHPKNHVPPRPSGQRHEPSESSNELPNEQFNSFDFERDSGYHWSLGIGAFPFTFIPTFNMPGNRHYRNIVVDEHLEEADAFLSKIFILTAIMFLTLLLLA